MVPLPPISPGTTMYIYSVPSNVSILQPVPIYPCDIIRPQNIFGIFYLGKNILWVGVGPGSAMGVDSPSTGDGVITSAGEISPNAIAILPTERKASAPKA